MSDDGRRNAVLARAFVDDLARAGVAHAVVCPGSRSTPLALALAEHPALRVWTHVDERSAAFFGLGIARERREPVALLCSSGTAAANFLPAVVEAFYGRVPLVVLTADRPPELRDVGAPQTIDQIRIYGGHAKWFVDMPPPGDGADLLAHARTVAARAVATARSAPAGPVHVNFPFREPLVSAAPLPPQPAADPFAHATVVEGVAALGGEQLAALAGALAGIPDGAIVCGPQDDPAFAVAVTGLARTLGWPVFADPLSGVRSGPHDRTLVVDAYDAFLRDPAIAARFDPSVVLRFGALPTSKALWQHLGTLRGRWQILVDDGRGWRDPIATVSDVLHVDPVQFCRDLAAALARGAGTADGAWAQRWTALSARARAAIAAALEDDDAPFEGRVFHELAALLPDGANLVAGNSMPVRDLDAFFGGTPARVRVAANRGANGIDGVVSTALGFAAGDAPTLLALGDLSFYHDANGLLAAKLHGLRATIVVLDNDGGGIFSFLPQAAAVPAERFEQLFATPTGLDPARIAAVYGAAYRAPQNWPSFRAAVADGLRSDGLTIVHVRTERAANVARHRAIWDRVRDALHGATADV